MRAADAGDLRMVRQLVSKGAVVDMQCARTGPLSGSTALFYASLAVRGLTVPSPVVPGSMALACASTLISKAEGRCYRMLTGARARGGRATQAGSGCEPGQIRREHTPVGGDVRAWGPASLGPPPFTGAVLSCRCQWSQVYMVRYMSAAPCV